MTTSGDVVRADVEPAVRGESRTALARKPAKGSIGSRNCVSVIHDFLIQTPGPSGPGFISRARTAECQSSVRRRNRRHRGAGRRARLSLRMLWSLGKVADEIRNQRRVFRVPFDQMPTAYMKVDVFGYGIELVVDDDELRLGQLACGELIN